MIQEGFRHEESLFHRIDPRVKILWVCLFSVVVAVSQRFVVLVFALVLSLGLVLMARVAMGRLTRRLLPVNLFVLFLWFFLPFTVGGHPVFSVGPLAATREGLLYAMQISLKSNAIVIAMVALTASTSILTLGHALHALKVPEKIVYLFFFAYRYVFVIHQEYLRLLDAVKVRGFKAGTNIHTYKTFAYLVGMLLVRSAERAERVHKAMLCRGFRGRFYSLEAFSFTAIDILWVGIMSAFVLVLGVLEWMKTA
jgi:cobalt/nickel transport system permease protein